MNYFVIFLLLTLVVFTIWFFLSDHLGEKTYNFCEKKVKSFSCGDINKKEKKEKN